MRVNYKEIIRLIELDAAFSARYIAKITNISRPIVNKTINCVRELGLTYETVCKLSDKELTKIIKDFKKTTIVNNDSFNWIIPDYKYVHEELKRKGVTLSLLWTEYCVNNKDDARQKYQYSSFCSLYKKYTNDNDVVMHIDKKPGYSLEVDWAGTKILYYNKNTNICSKASVFIAVLPYSNFTYAEAFPAETTDFWIAGHINAFLYINGTPLVLIPDNLKTGVNKADRYDPVINKSYANMAEYYNIAIIPTRVVKPRDKATVEKAVKDITTWIIAALRNQKFFSINDINLSIKLKLNEYNNKKFNNSKMSRADTFMIEQPYLKKLPSKQYEYGTISIHKVQRNYHICVDKRYYSVPYLLNGLMVSVKKTSDYIYIYSDSKLVAKHFRKFGDDDKYSTNKDHMPEKHRAILNWDIDQCLDWANSVGPNTLKIVNYFLSKYPVKEQGVRSCLNLFSLSKKYSNNIIEESCAELLCTTANISTKLLKNIISERGNGADLPKRRAGHRNPVGTSRGLVRGLDYYKKTQEDHD